MSIKYIKNIKEPTEIDIIIPAAGRGTRMNAYGPKPLIKIKKNITILDNQIKILKKFLPNANIILVTGFESIKLMNNTSNDFIKIENERFEETNVVRSLGMGLRCSKNDVLVIYGDLIFNEYCITEMNLNKSSLLIGNNIMNDSEIGCTFNNEGFIENLMWDLEYKWGQISFFKGRELKMLKDICWNPDNYNLFGFEAINQIINRGGKFLKSYNEKMKIIDIDTSKDLEKVGEVL